ncbi:MAG: FkbM family methyltransferase [Alphaproteobacteria bacterium]
MTVDDVATATAPATDWSPPRTVEERIKGFLVPPRLYIRYKVAKERLRGEAEMRLLPFLVDRNRNAVDAGANKGTYSFVLGQLARTVYAYEPNPKMFAVLQRTAGRNVVASPLALSNQTGVVEFRVPRYGKGSYSNQGGTLSAIKVNDDYAALPVNAERLDALGLTDIGFIKIDVEGFETEVLEGAREIIARDRPTLMIEIEEKHTQVPIEDALAGVVALGYDGFFYDRAAHALRALGAFHPGDHHRNPVKGYVYNFIFFARR